MCCKRIQCHTKALGQLQSKSRVNVIGKIPKAVKIQWKDAKIKPGPDTGVD